MRQKVTVTAVLDKRRPLKNGCFSVKIRLIFKRSPRVYAISTLDFGVTEAEFEAYKTNQPRGKMKDKAVEIDNNIAKARKIIADLKEFDFDSFAQEWTGKRNIPNDLTLEKAFAWRIEKLFAEGRAGSAENSQTAYRSFIGYFKKNRHLTTITPKDLTGYLDYMKNSGRSPATVGIYARDLRRLYNELIEENLIPVEFYPFGKAAFRPPKGRKSKTALKIEDIRKIFNYVPDENTKEGLCIDLWKFSYLCSGMNLSDIAGVTYGDIKGDFLYFVRNKTERKNRSLKVIKVPLIVEAKQIIERRGNANTHPKELIFPVLKSEMDAAKKRRQIANISHQIYVHIRSLAAKLALSKLDVNGISARDAFASISLQMGRPLSDISESLGHSDISVTQHYLAQLQDEEKMEWQNKLL